MRDLYVIFTGKPTGLPLWDYLSWMGKEWTLKRLRKVLEIAKNNRKTKNESNIKQNYNRSNQKQD